MPTAAGAKTAFAHEFHGKTAHTMPVILYKEVYELRSASTGSYQEELRSSGMSSVALPRS